MRLSGMEAASILHTFELWTQLTTPIQSPLLLYVSASFDEEKQFLGTKGHAIPGLITHPEALSE